MLLVRSDLPAFRGATVLLAGRQQLKGEQLQIQASWAKLEPSMLQGNVRLHNHD